VLPIFFFRLLGKSFETNFYYINYACSNEILYIYIFFISLNVWQVQEKWKCDIPNCTTQGYFWPKSLIQFQRLPTICNIWNFHLGHALPSLFKEHYLVHFFISIHCITVFWWIVERNGTFSATLICSWCANSPLWWAWWECRCAFFFAGSAIFTQPPTKSLSSQSTIKVHQY
jgi:hypothetical protein